MISPFLKVGRGSVPEGIETLCFSSIEDVRVPAVGTHQLRVHSDGVPFEFLLCAREAAQYLLVFGQSALSNRSAVPLPAYHRWTWFDDFPEASCLALNDPTLYNHETMLGGWFQGTQSRFYMDDGVSLVRKIAEQLGIPASRIFFYGSSAGGFSSLMMAGLLEGATAIAEIPQTDMRKYHVKSALQALLTHCYAGMSLDEVSSLYADRLSVLDLYMRLGRIPNIVYLQNSADTIHLRNHMVPFIEGLECFLAKGKSRVLIEMYSGRTDKGDGHVAAPRGLVGRVIRDAFKSFGGR